MRTSALPSTSLRPVTASTAFHSLSSKRSCSEEVPRHQRGVRGGGDGRRAPTRRRRRSPRARPGGRAARSRRRSPPPPSAPRSRARRRGVRCWVCRFGGMSPDCLVVRHRGAAPPGFGGPVTRSRTARSSAPAGVRRGRRRCARRGGPPTPRLSALTAPWPASPSASTSGSDSTRTGPVSAATAACTAAGSTPVAREQRGCRHGPARAAGSRLPATATGTSGTSTPGPGAGTSPRGGRPGERAVRDRPW